MVNIRSLVDDAIELIPVLILLGALVCGIATAKRTSDCSGSERRGRELGMSMYSKPLITMVPTAVFVDERGVTNIVMEIKTGNN